MSNTSTDKRQSEVLISCGISSETADMAFCLDELGLYRLVARPYSTFKRPFRDSNVVPAWSLGALLDLLPDCVVVDGISYHRRIENIPEDDYIWEISYGSDDLEWIACVEKNDLIEAVLEMIEKLTSKEI